MDTVLHFPSFSLDTFQRPSRWITRERPKIDRHGWNPARTARASR